MSSTASIQTNLDGPFARTWSVPPPFTSTVGLGANSASSVSKPSTTSTISPGGDTGTPDFWDEAKLMAYKIAAPIIFIVGITGNILVILVLRRMRSDGGALHLFFTALAVSDICVQLFGLLPPYIDIQFGYSVLHASRVSCKVIYWFFYSFGTVSAWLLAAMTVQRAFSIVWPHKARSSCTRQQAKVSILVIVIIVFGMTSHLLYGIDFIEEHGMCYFIQSYIDNMMEFCQWMDLLSSSLLPFCVLLVSNAALIWKVSQSLRTAKAKLTGGRSDQLASRERKFSSMSVTLIAVSAAFVILSGPICVFSMVSFYADLVSLSTDWAYWKLLAAIANLLWYLNSAINFFLYILTGNKFRQELKALLGLGQSGGKKGGSGDF